MRNPSLRGDHDNMLSAGIPYQNANLVHAWQLLLQASPTARKSSAYQRDLIDTTRQSLGNMGLTLREEMAVAYDKKDAAAFETAADKFMALGHDIDKFLGASSTEFMLGKWIDDAKSWGADKNERAYYEKDARSLITIWGGGLTDYAGRQWSGLLPDYYLPRWQMLIDATLVELEGGKPVDPGALKKKWREHDLKFATTAGGHYATKPHGDFFALSRELYKKYAPLAAGSSLPTDH